MRLIKNVTVTQNVYSSVFLLQFLLWHEQRMHYTLGIFTIKGVLQKQTWLLDIHTNKIQYQKVVCSVLNFFHHKLKD